MRSYEHVEAAIAVVLGLALFTALSPVAAGMLLRVWLVCGSLCAMALLNDVGRGVTRRGGNLPLRVLGALALRGAALGFLVSCLVLLIAALLGRGG